jgi:FkbM family methyltransferase
MSSFQIMKINKITILWMAVMCIGYVFIAYQMRKKVHHENIQQVTKEERTQPTPETTRNERIEQTPKPSNTQEESLDPHCHWKKMEYQWLLPEEPVMCLRGSDDIMSVIIHEQGKWPDCEHLLTMISPYTPDDGIIVDVGANIGTCMMRTGGQKFITHAFEPQSDNLRYFRSTLQRIKSLQQFVSLHTFAVGDKKKESVIYRQANNGGNSVIGVVQPDEPKYYDEMAQNAETIKISTLDDELWPNASTQPPTILAMKMDIQGYEVNALHGAKRLLAAGAIKNIQLEADPHFLLAQNTSPEEICNILTNAGFTLSRKLDDFTSQFQCPNSATEIFAKLPTKPAYKAAIAYLIQLQDSQDIENLINSLKALSTHFKPHGKTNPYPVLLFYEPKDSHVLLPALREKIMTAAPTTHVEFHEAYTFYNHPIHVDPEHTAGNIDSSTGYRHMCRFWAYGIFQEPAMASLQYYWRLDTDLFLQQDVYHDPFNVMESSHIQYMHGALISEAPFVVTGLWNLTLEHMRSQGMHPRSMLPLANKIDGIENVNTMSLDKAIDFMGEAGYNLLIYYNNFEVSRPEIWRSQKYMSYFKAIDDSGGIFFYRWGDAPIRTMAVHMLLPESEVVQWKPSLTYYHQGTWTT